MDVLTILLSGLVGFVLGLLSNRLVSADQTRKNECGQLRRVLIELDDVARAIAKPDAFEFDSLPTRAWDEAPRALLRREAAQVDELCADAYAAVRTLNRDSAEVQRRANVRQYDEAIAKDDTRRRLPGVRDGVVRARTSLEAYVKSHCR